jgi:hypothetical protein
MKNKKSTAHGLSTDKLARLWNVGADTSEKDSKADPIQRRSELLRDWLESTLPRDPELDKLLPVVLMRLFRELKPFTGETFGSLLKDPETDISTIKKIKDFSRKMVESAKSESEHDAAAVIYYAAIASALVFHDQRITSFSHTKLKDSFAEMIKNTWLTSDLVKLFVDAQKLCRKREKEQN